MASAAGWYDDPWGEAPLRWFDGGTWTGWVHPPTLTLGAPVVQPPPPGDRDAPDGAADGVAGLARLLRCTDRVAVVDIETTGLYSTDRVVEVAVVTIDRAGVIRDEFHSLLNPLRDPGPTWLHGVTATMLRNAPLFEQVAPHLAALLDGAIFAAHNLPFDRRLLGYEFDRVGIDIDWGTGLDTLRATGGKLEVVCAEFGIVHDGAHCALHDARATAQLLVEVADDFLRCAPMTVEAGNPTAPRVLIRAEFPAVNVERPYLVQLARGVHAAPDVAPYVALLDSAVADLRLTADERTELAHLADELGLDERQRARAHREFLSGVIDAAVDDSVVTDDEFDHLSRLAALLDVDDNIVTARTNQFRLVTDTIELSPGLQICFTGAVVTAGGEPVERSELEDQARRQHLDPQDSVTAKACGLVIAADIASQSTKVKNAQKFGIPVATVADYFDALYTGKRLNVVRLPAKGVGLVCSRCGDSWIATRRAATPVCPDCRIPAREAGPSHRAATVMEAAPPVVETLVCAECFASWERPRVRGRRPLRCPNCV